MENFESKMPPENKEKAKNWEHPCQSCKFEGATSFNEQGTTQKMDVYSCSDHVQPGIYGLKDTKFKGDRIVVRYATSTNDTVGEISFAKNELDMENLRSRARNRQGKSDYTPAQIAIGKVL
ncbi:hypothetical protein KKG46_04225 [Patescibacteria group bacterium]|nr:hypothetical protein [Patescibacteria group bacterium]